MPHFLVTVSEILCEYHDNESIFEMPIQMDSLGRVIKRIANMNDIKFIQADMNADDLRGFIIVSNNKGDRQARVFISKNLNPCWTRFTACKELFHILDNDDALSYTQSHLISLLEKITGDIRTEGNEDSKIEAENKAVWAALEMLLPYEVRIFLRDAYMEKIINAYDIALMARIPERYVRMAMSGAYHEIITHYREGCGIADISPE